MLGADELRPVAVLADLAEGARRGASWRRAAAGARHPRDRGAGARGSIRRAGWRGRSATTFDASGEISDAASPELARLREERKGLAEHARGGDRAADARRRSTRSVLQDQFFTVRAERYVLPLKASAKSLGLGIVHDTSRTGETVFVEPTALVAANNRLKVVELEIRRESRRILEALTADVGAWRRPRCARAPPRWPRSTRWRPRRGWASATTATAIEIVDEPIVDLRAARHPLLALAHAARRRARSSPTTSRSAAPRRAILVVSGPNAGGKTVLMKTVGLAALMARAGLLVRGRRRAAGSASSTPCWPTSATGSRCWAICRRSRGTWRTWARS